MPNKKVLGLDFGLKRIGLSLSDDTRTIAFPLKYIPNTSPNEVMTALRDIIALENIGIIVIGMPVGLKGKQTDIGIKTLEFAEKLKINLKNLDEKGENPINVVIYDERFSTIQAQKSLISQNIKRKKRKEIVDSVASAFILQSYLDRNKNKIK